MPYGDYILFVIGILAIGVNVFAKSPALAIAVCFVMIGVMLWPEVNPWLQWGAVIIFLGGFISCFKYIKKG